jgi:hypothetical protein
MYCPQCGAQTEQATKFCKACGLKLSDHARLLEEPREAERMSEAQWRREKRLTTGIVMMMVTVFDLILFFVIFGSFMLANANPGAVKAGSWLILTFLSASLLCGGIGLWNLITSGFFRNFRERQLRAELALIEQKRKVLEVETEKNQASLPHPKHDVELAGVTENTTRELQSIAVTNQYFSGE